MSPEDTVTVESNALASGPVITGSIEPERRADLRAEVSAVVVQVLKENGEAVRKGDVLVRLDETAIRDSVNSADEATRAAEQTLAQAQRMFERQTTLRSSGMVSTQALEDAEIRRNNAQSDLAAAKSRSVSARQQLTRTLVRAPFDGIVIKGDLSQSLGAPVQRGEVLLTLAPNDSFRLIVEVDEADIAAIRPGQTGELALAAVPDRALRFTTRRIVPVATSAQERNYFEVEAALDAEVENLEDEAAYQPEVMDVRGAIAAL
eukprot:gene27643-27916_t